MNSVVSLVLREISKQNKSSVIIAVDGRCAAGKTYLASRIKEAINCNVIHMDHFFLRPKQRTSERFREPGGNVDYERFTEEVLKPLKQGKAFSYKKFDCKCMSLTSDIHIEPSKVTIVEGTYSCHPAMWDYYDYRVFLDIDPKTQMERILTRNGREAAEVFRNRWIPLEEIYFSSYNIRERCDDSFVMKE